MPLGVLLVEFVFVEEEYLINEDSIRMLFEINRDVLPHQIHK
jgi:hypothetical protein